LIDVPFLRDTFFALASGVPLTLQLTVLSLGAGALLAAGLVAMQHDRFPLLAFIAKPYVFIFRGSPLLVQMYLIYFGLGQFPALRASFLWPFLREPYWCALLALALNEAAYSSEIMRGALRSVPSGYIEAGKACGMSSFLLLRRIIIPTALRNSLPACANEIIVMVKSTALVSTITLLDITGVAAEIVSDTYRSIEVFLMAGAIYLTINFAITNAVSLVEYKLSRHLREA